jgi:hypothetical protein
MQLRTFIHGISVPMRPVYAPQEIEFLIKEYEVLTGHAGRIFVITSADWLIYRVQWHSMAIKVERLDELGQVLSTLHQQPAEFSDHNVIEALRAGQLFTPQVAIPADL